MSLGRKLGSSLPDERISPATKDSQGHKRWVPLSEIGGVWKAPQHRASYVAEDQWMAFGIVGRPFDRLSNLVQGLVAEPAPTVFVSSSRLFKLVLRGAPEGNAQAHRPSPARTEAFTSLHGMTSFG